MTAKHRMPKGKTRPIVITSLRVYDPDVWQAIKVEAESNRLSVNSLLLNILDQHVSGGQPKAARHPAENDML